MLSAAIHAEQGICSEELGASFGCIRAFFRLGIFKKIFRSEEGTHGVSNR